MILSLLPSLLWGDAYIAVRTLSELSAYPEWTRALLPPSPLALALPCRYGHHTHAPSGYNLYVFRESLVPREYSPASLRPTK